MKQSASIIYDVDISKKVTSIQVRDAIIRCFLLAHKEVLNDIKEVQHFKSKKDFENFKLLDVQLMIRKIFTDLHEDFNNPTKDSLLKVIDQLREYARNFRNPDIVNKHACEIMKLVNKLE
jgi:hypothetical protein